MGRKRGFTLIELLVVIAIIGILAAIIFPVFARAKASAYKASDISSMNSIRTALQLYKADQGAYPPTLLGYATLYNGHALIPANLLAGALYPKRVDSLETFRPAMDRVSGTTDTSTGQPVPASAVVTTAVWPNKLGTGLSAQHYGPTDGQVIRCVDGPNDVFDVNQYYKISGYDVAEVKDGNGGTRTELHYAPFWSAYAVATDPCRPQANDGLGSAADDPRQLGYSDPPDSTVVTWNSYFRDYDATGALTHMKGDVVLFLSGGARPYDSLDMSAQSWKAMP